MLNLAKNLLACFGLTIIFISHNLAVVRQMSDDATVLKTGRVIETHTSDDIFTNPQAPYSRELLSLTPEIPGQ